MGWDCASVVVCPRKNKSEKHVEKKEHESITGENVNECAAVVITMEVPRSP